jgi:dTDP-4-dehydrorhamnose 3,5-epimerase
MKATPTEIPGVLILEPKVFADDRGFFFESFNHKQFTAATESNVEFVQDNHSRSSRNVLRGLHYQTSPHEQGKLVRVVQGEVFDVAVDIRRDSPTFGAWTGVTLSADNRRQLWIPPGLAHGFIVLSETAEVIYKASRYYAPTHERSLLWNDPAINISWPVDRNPILSSKDAQGHSFAALPGVRRRHDTETRTLPSPGGAPADNRRRTEQATYDKMTLSLHNPSDLEATR